MSGVSSWGYDQPEIPVPMTGETLALVKIGEAYIALDRIEALIPEGEGRTLIGMKSGESVGVPLPIDEVLAALTGE